MTDLAIEFGKTPSVARMPASISHGDTLVLPAAGTAQSPTRHATIRDNAGMEVLKKPLKAFRDEAIADTADNLAEAEATKDAAACRPPTDPPTASASGAMPPGTCGGPECLHRIPERVFDGLIERPSPAARRLIRPADEAGHHHPITTARQRSPRCADFFVFDGWR